MLTNFARFKKSGEFDRLRQEFLARVAESAGMTTLKTRVDEVAQQRFESDPKLSFMGSEAIFREMMQEMERYPVVDRVAEDTLSDPSFQENIRNSLHKILQESKGENASPMDQEGQNNAAATDVAAKPPLDHPLIYSAPAFNPPPPVTAQPEPGTKGLPTPGSGASEFLDPAGDEANLKRAADEPQKMEDAMVT